MKESFNINHHVVSSGIMMACLFIMTMFAVPAQSQEQNQEGVNNHKVQYGISVGFTSNKVDLYLTLDGHTQAMESGNHSFYTQGFHIATIFDYRIGKCLSLRAMPGITYFSHNWEDHSLISIAPSPAPQYNVESVCGEIPIDVKLHPFHWGNFEPYITSGICYSYDFSSLKSNDESIIHRLNPNDLRYTCGFGVDCQTQYIKVGVEFKAGFGLLSPSTTGYENYYFHGGPTYLFGINIEG